MGIKVGKLDYSDYKVENISKDRANFSKLVLEKKHKIAVENMVLAFSFVEFLTDRVRETKGTEEVTDTLLADYFNVSLVLSGLILTTILEDSDLEVDFQSDVDVMAQSSTIDIAEFPANLVDSVCNLSKMFPNIKVKRVDDDSVLCTYSFCEEIPDDLELISSRIRHFRKVVLDEVNYLNYILGSYFNNKNDRNIAKTNLNFFTATGFRDIMESLVEEILAGTDNEVVFYKTEEDISLDLSKLTDTFNSFDGFKAEWKGTKLIVRFLESDDDTSSTVVRESLSMVTLCEDIKGTFLRLIGE